MPSLAEKVWHLIVQVKRVACVDKCSIYEKATLIEDGKCIRMRLPADIAKGAIVDVLERIAKRGDFGEGRA